MFSSPWGGHAATRVHRHSCWRGSRHLASDPIAGADKISRPTCLVRLRYEVAEKKEIAMNNVIVVIGAGSIGQAIVRRVSAGKRILLADLRQQNADAAAKVLNDAGFDVSTATVD